MRETTLERVRDSATALQGYCKAHDWAGFDPYDALNSRLFAMTPFSRSRVCRIGLTQVMKRLPIDLRPLLMVQRGQNPKAMALFLAASLKLSQAGLPGQEELAGAMVDRLAALRSPGTDYWCWGYSFPWQTRTILVPRGAPNLVCTTFVANELLNAFETGHGLRCLEMAKSAADYILEELYWEDGLAAGFSYPLPALKTRVHNANFLGAALFCRIYKHTREDKFVVPAMKAARYSASTQHEDGSWDYGELPTQRWVDNFHTGYNLLALRSIGQDLATDEFGEGVRRGFEFYRSHFFRGDGAPRYFHDRTYPIDIHCVAQSIITLLGLRDLAAGSVELAHSVFRWAMEHMWDEKGYFYYRALPLFRYKISYMRWSQAWMLLALATLLEHDGQ